MTPITIMDTTGRDWTIIPKEAVAGFRWTVYLHHRDTPRGALEVIIPGGVANGWVEMDPTPTNVRAILTALMRVFLADVGQPMPTEEVAP